MKKKFLLGFMVLGFMVQIGCSSEEDGDVCEPINDEIAKVCVIKDDGVVSACTSDDGDYYQYNGVDYPTEAEIIDAACKEISSVAKQEFIPQLKAYTQLLLQEARISAICE